MGREVRRIWEEVLGKRKDYDENILYDSNPQTPLFIHVILKGLRTHEILLSLRFEHKPLRRRLMCFNSWSSIAGTLWRCCKTFRMGKLDLEVSCLFQLPVYSLLPI